MFYDKIKTITIIIIITCHLVPTQLQLEESVQTITAPNLEISIYIILYDIRKMYLQAGKW